MKALTQNLSLFAAGFGIGLTEPDHYSVEDATSALFRFFLPGFQGAAPKGAHGSYRPGSSARSSPQ